MARTAGARVQRKRPCTSNSARVRAAPALHRAGHRHEIPAPPMSAASPTKCPQRCPCSSLGLAATISSPTAPSPHARSHTRAFMHPLQCTRSQRNPTRGHVMLHETHAPLLYPVKLEKGNGPHKLRKAARPHNAVSMQCVQSAQPDFDAAAALPPQPNRYSRNMQSGCDAQIVQPSATSSGKSLRLALRAIMREPAQPTTHSHTMAPHASALPFS